MSYGVRTSATSLRKSWPVFASSEVRGIVATLPVFVMSHQILCDIFSESPTLCTGVLRFGLQHLHYPMLSDSESPHFCPLSLCPPNCAYRVVSVATLIEYRWPMSSSTLSQCSKAGAPCGNLSQLLLARRRLRSSREAGISPTCRGPRKLGCFEIKVRRMHAGEWMMQSITLSYTQAML